MNNILRKKLCNLKILPNIKGYYYILDCISCLMENSARNIASVYQEIAVKYNTKPTSVERNIINAIDNAWLKADIEILTQEFGNTILESKCKPTAKHFLFTLADKIKLETPLCI